MADEPDITLSARLLDTLAYVAHLLASGIGSRNEALQYILKATVDLAAADFGTIHLYDKETHTLRTAAFYGRDQDFRKISPYEASKGITGRVLQTAKSYLVSDVRQDPYYVELFPETLSELAVPIKYRAEVVGVLSLESTKRSHFKEEQIRIVELLTSILAATFEKEEIEHLRTQVHISKPDPDAETAFVLTPFSEPFNKYYFSIIRPAVQSTGLVSLRADEIFSPTEIIQDIWAAINKAKVIVAELTTRNPNVMYELGLSHAVNKPVIMITQSTNDIPFDLRSLRCIVYDTTEPDWAEKLRSSLSEFIKSVVTSPAHKPLFHGSSTEVLRDKAN